jgi:hypothetical protein
MKRIDIDHYFDHLISLHANVGIDAVKGFFNGSLPHPIGNYPYMGHFSADVPDSLMFFRVFINECVRDNAEEDYPQVGEEILDQLMNAFMAYDLFKSLSSKNCYNAETHTRRVKAQILSSSLKNQIVIFSKTNK